MAAVERPRPRRHRPSRRAADSARPPARASAACARPRRATPSKERKLGRVDRQERRQQVPLRGDAHRPGRACPARRPSHWRRRHPLNSAPAVAPSRVGDDVAHLAQRAVALARAPACTSGGYTAHGRSRDASSGTHAAVGTMHLRLAVPARAANAGGTGRLRSSPALTPAPSHDDLMPRTFISERPVTTRIFRHGWPH